MLIIVQAKAIPKDIEALDKILLASENLISNTRAEDGNISYNLYSNTEDDTLLFVEFWKSKKDLEIHLETDHFIKFGEDIANYLSEELAIDVFDGENIEL